MLVETDEEQHFNGPIRVKNTIGGVPKLIEIEGGFRCILCESANYSNELICADCREDLEALRRMRRNG